MFCGHPVNPLKLTEMTVMCHMGIHALNCLCSIRQSIEPEGLMHLGKDWTLMLQLYLILSLNVFNKDWI